LGAGQFNNAARTNHSQNKNSYEGKLLRFNIEPDADKDTFDKWIPNDNPFNTARQSGVWSSGHRNAQGLAYAVIAGTGRIYSSEHGPFSDDEVNIIERGKNYGHPLVVGYNDGNYDGLAAGVTDNPSLPGIWHTAYPTIVNERSNAKKIGTAYKDPIKTLYPNSNTFLRSVLTQKRDDKESDPEWPSEAPSSIDVYTSSAIPGWKNSLLIPTLKQGKLIRLQLNESGTAVMGDTINYFKGRVRYRDIAISPDGSKIYLSVDSSKVSSGPSEENEKEVSYLGTILEFSYAGKASDTTSGRREKPTEITETEHVRSAKARRKDKPRLVH
jgi:glucose/arabinose dehydrogenase